MDRGSRAELLAEYAALLNREGLHSPSARRLLDEHRRDPEFVSLALLSRDLKRALERRRAEPWLT